MGNFREHNRRGSFDAARGGNARFGNGGGSFGGNREGGSGGFRGRSSGGFGGRPRSFGGGSRGGSYGDSDRRPMEMHEATCSKCSKQCQVPFRPTGSKPVFCSDCFRQQGDSGSSNFAPRSQSSSNAGSGISQEQFKQLNMKLDKILAAMQELELEVIEDEDAEDAEADEEEDEE